MNEYMKYSRIYAAVDLDAVCANMEAMKANLPKDTAVYGVVKTDGYGHGAVPVARAIDPYVEGYAVATVDEGLNLRRHGIAKPVLVLGYTEPFRFEEMITEEVLPAIFQMEDALILSEEAVRLGKTMKLHIALDTGMGRVGFQADEAAADTVAFIAGLEGIEIEGIFTHFANADEADKTYTRLQLRRFWHFMDLLKERGVEIPIKHCANSAGIIDLPEAAGMDVVRAGISIYGLYPSEEVDKESVKLTPALELKSEVAFIKTLPAGCGISYGTTYVTQSETAIATIPVGYGDGYPRNLSGKGSVLLHGRRVPILGRICMDQMMVDVTDIGEVRHGDVVTLIGRDGEEEITVEEVAELAGTFNYELICGLGKRIPRIYLKDQKICSTKDYFTDWYE